MDLNESYIGFTPEEVNLDQNKTQESGSTINDEQNIYTGNLIKDARTNAGMTQSQLAEKIKATKFYVSRLENGKIIPSINMFFRIMNATGMRIELQNSNNQSKRTSENEKFWHEYTAESTKFYKNKMKELLTLSNPNDEQSIEKRLEGSLHGAPTPNHWMYFLDDNPKKGLAWDDHITFQFLIEYDIYEPHVGIYFGCKCVSDLDYDHEIAIEKANEVWAAVKLDVIRVLNASFENIDFTHRFKKTNNAENHTYWPFWISLYEDEDINEVGLRALQLIRKIYIKFKDKPDDECFKQDNPDDECVKQDNPEAEPQKCAKPKMRFTLSAKNELDNNLNKIGKRRRKEIYKFSDEFWGIIMKSGWFVRSDIFECAYQLNPNSVPEKLRPLKEKDLPDIIDIIIDEVYSRLVVDNQKSNKSADEKISSSDTNQAVRNITDVKEDRTPWVAVSRVFMNSNGEIFSAANLRNAKTKEDTEDSSRKKAWKESLKLLFT